MTKKYRCPRCGEIYEQDFCPNCDLHFNQNGVFRPQEEQHHNDDDHSASTQISEVEQTSQQFFNKRALPEGEFSKDIFNKTVGEVIEENQLTYNYRDVLPSLTNLPTPSPDDENLNNDSVRSIDEEESKFALINEENKEGHGEGTDQSTEDEGDTTQSQEKSDVQKGNNRLDDYVAHFHSDDVSTEQENKQHNKHLSIHLSKKGLCILLIGLILFGGLSYGAIYYQQQQEIALVEKKESTIERKINAFYVDHNPKEGFLKQTVTKEKIAPIEDLIATLETKDKQEAAKMDKQLAQLETNSELQQKVNDLFVSPRIEGKNIHNVAIKENVSIQLVEKKNPKTAFEKAINESIRNAKAQQKTMNTAKEEVKALIYKGQVNTKATEKAYQVAQKRVASIQNKTVKQTLANQLKIVKQTLDERKIAKKALEKQKKEQEAAQKEAQKASEEKQKQQVKQQTSQAQAKQTDETSSIDATEEKNAKAKALADPTNNTLTDFASKDPYAWEEGIQSKVINTCIDRGYISSNNYVLNKAYEYNGEGYYNLYSISNGTTHYLVTINCKTGWFKGNGG